LRAFLAEQTATIRPNRHEHSHEHRAKGRNGEA
jgi:hypothetical protein